MNDGQQDWETTRRQRNERWADEVERSQQLPEALVAGKVFALCVADGKVLYKVTALRKTQCQVQIVEGGPDHYRDAVLGDGGWFPKRVIEPLVLRHHRLTALFRQR
jgi:hypothetical protein